jgi:hypothetical protein
MAGEMFQVDKIGLYKLEQFYKRAPKQFRVASASMLNHFAFGTKKTTFGVLFDRMIIRDQRFVKSKIRVKMASKRAPVRNQESIVGSIEDDRFSGWIEQETGKKVDKKTGGTRTFSLAGRRGSKKRKALQRARMKPENDLIKPEDFRHQDGHHRVLRMLKELSAKREKKPFKVYGHNSMAPGVYAFKGRKLTMLQRFSTSKQPDRVPWMQLARTRYFRSTNMQHLWGKTISFVLRVDK